MILDSRFWILDCGLKEHESHCPKRLRGERAERTGPPTLWYLGNVNGPQCHANQVVPATGLVDDAMTPARKSGCILSQTSDPRFLSSVPESTVLWQSFSASATLKLDAMSPAPVSLGPSGKSAPFLSVWGAPPRTSV